MKKTMLLFLTLLLSASPIELSSKPFTNAHNIKGREKYSTTPLSAVHSKSREHIKSPTTVFEKKLLCLTNKSELMNSTMLNGTATSSHKCNNSDISTEPDVSTKKTGPLTVSNILAITAFVLVLLIGTLGNAYVIYTFTITFKKRTVTETMLIYLAFVDLFASLINPLLYIYWITTRFSRWDFGIIGCKILPPVGPISTTASSAIIIIIFIDRYRSIVTPFRTRISKLQVHIICNIGILTSVVFYSYYISALSVNKDGKCQVQEVDTLAYSIPNVAVTLLWDLAFIIIFIPTNIRIFTHLKLSRELQSDILYSKARKRENRKVMRILLTVGVVFAMLVFPKDILHLAFTISWMFPNGIERSPVLLTLNSWFKVLQVSNSCVNIFIYSKMHNRFRSEIINFLRRLLRKPAIRLDNDSYEDKTNVSLDYSEATNGGLLKVINDKIVKRLSPKFKRKVPYDENGGLESLSQSPHLRKLNENTVDDCVKKRKYTHQKLEDGKMESLNGTGSTPDRHKKSDRRLLLHNNGLRNEHHNFDSDDEGLIKSSDVSKESRARREDMSKGLLRMGSYAQNGCQHHTSQEEGPPQLNSNVHDDGTVTEDGREIAKILECYKKSGIESRETHC